MLKKFEEGVFSDLRNLKPGVDASLEEPKASVMPLTKSLVLTACISRNSWISCSSFSAYERRRNKKYSTGSSLSPHRKFL
jgi:hypothetical protein